MVDERGYRRTPLANHESTEGNSRLFWEPELNASEWIAWLDGRVGNLAPDGLGISQADAVGRGVRETCEPLSRLEWCWAQECVYQEDWESWWQC